MEPKFVSIKEKMLIGKHMTVSLAVNKTGELWQNFAPGIKDIKNRAGKELYSIEIYPQSYFSNFNPVNEFEKWAAVEVRSVNDVPNGMESVTIPAGDYTVFTHKGPASAAMITYQHIFQTWLPGSDFLPDDRPHFAVMGEKYKNEDPSSEEEFWVPVKPKK